MGISHENISQHPIRLIALSIKTRAAVRVMKIHCGAGNKTQSFARFNKTYLKFKETLLPFKSLAERYQLRIS